MSGRPWIALCTIAACAARSPIVEPPSSVATPDPSPRPVAELRWEPALLAAVDESLTTLAPVTLNACAERCVPLVTLPAPRQIAAAGLSPRRSSALVVHREPGASWQLEVLDVSAPQRRWSVALDIGLDPLHGPVQYVWGRDDAVLVTWGSGTFAASGELLRDGRKVLRFGAAAYQISPDQRYLATYAPAGAPAPEPLLVYALGTGMRVLEAEAQRVDLLRWVEGGIVVSTPGGRPTTHLFRAPSSGR